MRIRTLVALFLIVLANGAARAIEPPNSGYGANTGFYLGAGATYAIENFDGGGFPSADNSWGANGFVGYRVLSRLALEVQAEWAEGFDLGSGGIEIESWVVTANARAYFTETRVQPFLLVGLGALTAKGGGVRETGFAARAGGGLNIWATERLSVLMEVTYVGATGDVSDLGYGSFILGLEYHF
jgi:hypothetical protein